MLKTRYATPTFSTLSVESYAILVINHRIAEYFGGKCYQYLHDVHTSDATILKTTGLIDYFFPYSQVTLIYRRADLADYRTRAIELVKEGKAVAYGFEDATQHYARLSADEQAILAEDESVGIRLAEAPDGILGLDDIVTGYQEYKYTADAVGIPLFYPMGFANSTFCNAVDDEALEVTHVIRERSAFGITAQEMLFHIALGNPPPLYGHIEIGHNMFESTLPWDHMMTEMPPGILNTVVYNHLAKSQPGKTCDFSFLRTEVENKLDRMALQNEIAEWFMNSGLITKTKILQVMFPLEDVPDLQRAGRHITQIMAEWKYLDIKNFVDDFLNGPTYDMDNAPRKWEAADLKALGLALKTVEFTPQELSKTVLDVSLSLSVNVVTSDKLLNFALFGQPRPVFLYEVMADLGKNECLKRIESAERIVNNSHAAIRG